MSAQDSVSSIVALLTELVRIPSRGGIDSYDPVLEAVSGWLTKHGVPHELLEDGTGRRVGVWGLIEGAGAGPAYLVNATVDTAPFGDESRWTHPPLSAEQDDGWLYGRGSGDSKAGVAIFCHTLAGMAVRGLRSGRLAFLFDAAEHTGEFGGIRRFFEGPGRDLELAGAYIGYPNLERIAVGGRGFLRADIKVHGRAAHTGSSQARGVSAILRAAELVQRIDTFDLLQGRAPSFPLPPRMSVPAIEGGSGFSLVPDECSLKLDVRTTTDVDAAAARGMIESLVAGLDAKDATLPATEIAWIDGWPAYALSDDTAIVRALAAAAREVLGRDVTTGVVGPSSVGNYLYTHGVPATNGFGVTCENVHAVDERIALDSIAPVFEIYQRALQTLMTD